MAKTIHRDVPKDFLFLVPTILVKMCTNETCKQGNRGDSSLYLMIRPLLQEKIYNGGKPYNKSLMKGQIFWFQIK